MNSPDISTIKELLSKNVLQVKFTKADDTERVMKCTLRPDLLPPKETDTPKRNITSTAIRVLDVDLNEWRSFKLESLIEYKIA